MGEVSPANFLCRAKSLQSCLTLCYTMDPPGSSVLRIAAAAAKLLQSCPTLCDPTDGSPLGSPVLGILQARILEWVAIAFSNAWKWKVKVKSLSRVWLFATLWTIAHQGPLSLGLSWQEHWNGLPCPPPGDLPWSLWYSVFLLSILKSQILLHFKWSCGPLFPKCNTVLLTFHLGVGGMVHGSQFKNADCARKFPHSGMLGSWAIVPRDQTHISRVSCSGRRVLYHQCHLLLRCLLETLLEIQGVHFQHKPTEPSTPC